MAPKSPVYKSTNSTDFDLFLNGFDQPKPKAPKKPKNPSTSKSHESNETQPCTSLKTQAIEKQSQKAKSSQNCLDFESALMNIDAEVMAKKTKNSFKLPSSNKSAKKSISDVGRKKIVIDQAPKVIFEILKLNR